MELTWYGLSCFRITERGYPTIITDPYDPAIGLTLPRLRGDIITISHEATGHAYTDAVTGYKHVITGPGEYEMGGVFVTGVASHESDLRNVHYRFDYGTLAVAHMGDMSTVPNQTQIEALGEIHVLLLPVGGGKSLNAVQAAELVSMIEPGIVVPMHYQQPGLQFELDSVERFIKEMGLSNIEELTSLRVVAGSLSEETQTVVLQPRS
jgi:L-ascorbate metabolism protein UlaG (beta-lactamase superfamily)